LHRLCARLLMWQHHLAWIQLWMLLSYLISAVSNKRHILPYSLLKSVYQQSFLNVDANTKMRNALDLMFQLLKTRLRPLGVQQHQQCQACLHAAV
jgi:hypothetical protein